jgi:hypothetical protein
MDLSVVAKEAEGAQKRIDTSSLSPQRALQYIESHLSRKQTMAAIVFLHSACIFIYFLAC